MNSLIAQPTRRLAGTCTVPGDKSISHRALMVAALTVGETRVQNLLEGDDVMRTASALRLLGAEIAQLDDGSWTIVGRGVGGLQEADDVLDLGNAGTGVRLLMGVVAGLPGVTHFTGDASLRQRPMGRVATPLRAMGAKIIARDGERLPLSVGRYLIVALLDEDWILASYVSGAVGVGMVPRAFVVTDRDEGGAPPTSVS